MEEALTDSTYLILLALLKPQHGYAIMKEISKLTHGAFEIGPASMYTILKRLQAHEMIQLEESNDRKKIYRITQKGRNTLVREIERRRLFYKAGADLMSEIEGQEKGVSTKQQMGH